jgi:hypothetical protein
MRNTAASSVVLPWEKDEWSCLFNPDSDIMDTLLPASEPKHRAVEHSHVDDERVARVTALERHKRSWADRFFRLQFHVGMT